MALVTERERERERIYLCSGASLPVWQCTDQPRPESAGTANIKLFSNTLEHPLTFTGRLVVVVVVEFSTR